MDFQKDNPTFYTSFESLIDVDACTKISVGKTDPSFQDIHQNTPTMRFKNSPPIHKLAQT